jgi:hypothetical protein
MLRALSSVGVFAEETDGRFRLTPLAEMLRSDRPDSQRELAIMIGDEHFRAWADFEYSIRTGKPAFDRQYGKPVFEYLAGHPEAARTFDAAMTGVHGAETQAMIAAYDFSAFHTVVDVGGGNGTMLSGVLDANPSLRGVLFDLTHVIDRAREPLQRRGLDVRCDLVAGNFFEAIVPGGDAYLLRHIIHDWHDERALTILQNCKKAMPAHAKLLVIENVIPPGNEPSFGKWLDLNMLVIPGGKERTEAEYRDLYAKAGFRLTRILPTPAAVSVIEGTIAN